MRLIDADKIIDSLGGSDIDFAIGAVIDEQPTAFDLDKVVEQLKDLKAMYWFSIANVLDWNLELHIKRTVMICVPGKSRFWISAYIQRTLIA